MELTPEIEAEHLETIDKMTTPTTQRHAPEAVEAAMRFVLGPDPSLSDEEACLITSFGDDDLEPVSRFENGLARIPAAEVEWLREWKQSAMSQLAAWDNVWESAGKPGELGCCKAAATQLKIEHLRAQLEATQER